MATKAQIAKSKKPPKFRRASSADVRLRPAAGGVS